jgi:spore germination protein YaaH
VAISVNDATRWWSTVHHVRLALTALALSIGLVASDASSAASRLVLAYYVPYDSTSWASLQVHADQLDILAAQWMSVDACGGLGSRDDQTLKQFAHDHGLKVVPSLFTLSGWLNHRLLADDEVRATFLQNVVGYTVDEGYDGFDLDLEGVDPADRQALSDFTRDLADALHAQGKLLTLAIPAKERETNTGWAGAFDYAALGNAADLVTVMAYEYRGPFSGPGSVAPYDWVGRVAAFATRQIPSEKVLLGLAVYGYDWNTTSGGTLSLGYPQARAIAEQAQAEPGFDDAQQSLTFSYTADAASRVPPAPGAGRVNHAITLRSAPPCDAVPPLAPGPTPTRAPEPDTPQAHEVWVEGSGSVAARLGLALSSGARGVSVWRLGLEDPGSWPLFDQWRGVS